MIKLLIDFCFECEFYLKVALSCTILQQVFYWLLSTTEQKFSTQVLLYWLVGSISFYSIGFLIENIIKKNLQLTEKLTARVQKVKQQKFPLATLKGVVLGETKSLIAVTLILFLAPETSRGNSLLVNFTWFLMRIVLADFCFYVAHWLLHRKFLQKIHLKHHEFQDTSSFVAGHKSLVEYIIVTITDLLPIFILGYDINQL
ncbi:MAG: sterol desaturase family protein, partial [Cyanobacteria bacterium P01_A01_bin.83]